MWAPAVGKPGRKKHLGSHCSVEDRAPGRDWDTGLAGGPEERLALAPHCQSRGRGALPGTALLMPQSLAAKLRIVSTRLAEGADLGRRMWGDMIIVPFYRGIYRG